MQRILKQHAENIETHPKKILSNLEDVHRKSFDFIIEQLIHILSSSDTILFELSSTMHLN